MDGKNGIGRHRPWLERGLGHRRRSALFELNAADKVRAIHAGAGGRVASTSGAAADQRLQRCGYRWLLYRRGGGCRAGWDVGGRCPARHGRDLRAVGTLWQHQDADAGHHQDCCRRDANSPPQRPASPPSSDGRSGQGLLGPARPCQAASPDRNARRRRPGRVPLAA